MRVEYEFMVEAAPSTVRSLLTDVERSAACAPGVSLESSAPGEYGGRLRLRVGSTTVTYRGTATVSRTEGAFRLELEGQEARGSGVAKGAVTFALAGDQQRTRVAVDADVTVTGRLGSLESSVLSDAIRRLFVRFGECVIAAVAVEEPDTETVVGPEGGIAVARRASDSDVTSTVTAAAAEPMREEHPRHGDATRARASRGAGRAGGRQATAAPPSPTARTTTPSVSRPVQAAGGTRPAVTADMTAAGDDDLLAESGQQPRWPLRPILLLLAVAAAVAIAIQVIRRWRD